MNPGFHPKSCTGLWDVTCEFSEEYLGREFLGDDHQSAVPRNFFAGTKLTSASIHLQNFILILHTLKTLKELHWLQISQRIDFKLYLLVHWAVVGQAPTYLTEGS
jgi:hypothetical protein